MSKFFKKIFWICDLNHLTWKIQEIFKTKKKNGLKIVLYRFLRF